MKEWGIAAALAGALLCLGGGLLWTLWKTDRDKSPPLRETLEELRRIDPRLVIGREVGRISTGLTRPHGLAAGPGGRLYVSGESELAVLGSDGLPLVRRPLAGPGLCLAVDASPALYLGMGDHIEVFDPQGDRKASWDRPDPQTWITSIAVSGKAVFAADFGHRRVLRYDPSGRLLGEIRPPEGGFLIPSPYFDVAVDAEGHLWVAHTGKHQLERYRPDGTALSSWGMKSARIEGFSGCCNPSHFAIRPDGTFVTVEKGLVRIKLHRPDGAILGVVAGPGEFRDGAVGLDVAVDAEGRILVLDPAGAEVRVYITERPSF